MSQSRNQPDLKQLSRGWSDDMTPKAISARLQKLSQLYRAWKRLNLQLNENKSK
jgi:hypothetical protein